MTAQYLEALYNERPSVLGTVTAESPLPAESPMSSEPLTLTNEARGNNTAIEVPPYTVDGSTVVRELIAKLKSHEADLGPLKAMSDRVDEVNTSLDWAHVEEVKQSIADLWRQIEAVDSRTEWLQNAIAKNRLQAVAPEVISPPPEDKHPIPPEFYIKQASQFENELQGKSPEGEKLSTPLLSERRVQLSAELALLDKELEDFNESQIHSVSVSESEKGLKWLAQQAEKAVGYTGEARRRYEEVVAKFDAASLRVEEAKLKKVATQEKINIVDQKKQTIEGLEQENARIWPLLEEARYFDNYDRLRELTDLTANNEARINAFKQEQAKKYGPLNEKLEACTAELAMAEDSLDMVRPDYIELSKTVAEQRRVAETLAVEAYGHYAAENLAEKIHSDPLAEGLMFDALGLVYVDPKHPEYGTRAIERRAPDGQLLRYDDLRVAGFTEEGGLVTVVSTGGDPAPAPDKPSDAWNKAYLIVQFDPSEAARAERQIETTEGKLLQGIDQRQNYLDGAEIGHDELQNSSGRSELLANLKAGIENSRIQLQSETDSGKIEKINDSIVESYLAINLIERIELETELLGIEDDSERARTIKANIESQLKTLRLIYDINSKSDLIESVSDLGAKRKILEDRIRYNDRLMGLNDNPGDMRPLIEHEGGVEDSRRLIHYEQQEVLAPARAALEKLKSDAIEFKMEHSEDEDGLARIEVKIGEQEVIIAAIKANIGRLEGRFADRIETIKYLRSGDRRSEIVNDTESCRRIIDLIDDIHNSESQAESSETTEQTSLVEQRRTLFDVKVSGNVAKELANQIDTNTKALGFLDGVEGFDLGDHVNGDITTLKLWAGVKEKGQSSVDLDKRQELLDYSRAIERDKKALIRLSKARKSATVPDISTSQGVSATMEPTTKEAQKGATRGPSYFLKLGLDGPVGSLVRGNESIILIVDKGVVVSSRLDAHLTPSRSSDILPIKYLIEAFNRRTQNEQRVGLGHAATAELVGANS